MNTTPTTAVNTPDQFAEGEGWSVARFGSYVVVCCDGQDDDIQCADAAAAIVEFDDLVAVLSE